MAMFSSLSVWWWCSWLVVWPCLWDHTWASKRLNFCSEEAQYDVGSGSGNGSVPMPPVLYFQTSTRSLTRPVRMNYAWSTVGFPTLFLSQSFDNRTCSNGGFSVDVSNYERSQKYGSVDIAGSDSGTSLAIVFRRLIRFNSGKAADSFNTSQAADDSETYLSVYLNQSIHWTYDKEKKQIKGVSQDVHFQLTFRFQLPWTEDDRRISYFPKTRYTRNSTVFDVTISDFNYTKSLKNGRLALEMIMMNGQQVDRSSTDMTSTVDDEYTPSVFRVWEYYFNSRNSHNNASHNRAYLQWKPISYQSHSRKSTKSQEANIVFPTGKAIGILGVQVPCGLASALFNDSSSLNGTAMYIVLGTDGDETYVNSDHQTWTAVVGFGRVPRDQISAEVIIIIIVALGVPALLIFLGSFYVTYKKKPWRPVARGVKRLRGVDGYEPIN